MSAAYDIDYDRWAKLDIFNQMGNIYSEVGRAFKTRGTPDHTPALARAIDLLNASEQVLSRAKSPKAREVARAKEQFLQIVSDPSASETAVSALDRYFMQFALAARLRR